MSSTLTWYSSGLGVKTGLTILECINDLVTLFNSKLADANFSWQVASSNNSVNTPYYIVLKRKNGSAGRILLVGWGAAATNTQPKMYDAAPGTATLFGTYFPAGNVDTPSNLNAASGVIMGDDTGVIKVWPNMLMTTIYPALFQAYYFDSAEGIFFAFQNPASNNVYLGAVGDIVVDVNDVAYPAVMSFGGSTAGTIGSTTVNWSWGSVALTAGTSATPVLRTNYGSANRQYYQAWGTNGWGSQVANIDVLTNDAIPASYFVPFPLLGQTKGEGFVLKMRQFAFGPSSSTGLATVASSGPVIQARVINASSAGSTNGPPWLTNFKL